MKFLNFPLESSGEKIIEENDNVEGFLEDEESKEDQERNNDQENETVIPRRGRKRKRGKGRQAVEKYKRNSGKKYRSYRGKGQEQQEKLIGPDCNCKKKCFELVTADERQNIFKSFWGLKSYNIQNLYIFGCLEVKKKARSTKPENSNSRRSHTVYYYIMSTSECAKIQVGKKAFLSIHGLQKNRGRLENIVKTIKRGSLMPKLDGRGAHQMHKKKYSNAQIDDVKEFIEKLPKYESHYSRNDNRNFFL